MVGVLRGLRKAEEEKISAPAKVVLVLHLLEKGECEAVVGQLLYSVLAVGLSLAVGHSLLGMRAIAHLQLMPSWLLAMLE